MGWLTPCKRYSWEVCLSSANQISAFCRTLKFHYSIYISQFLVHILNQIYSVYVLPIYVWKINYNINRPSNRWSSKQSVSFRLSYGKHVWIFLLSYTCCMASPSHPPNPITLIILGQRWSYGIFSYAVFSPCSKKLHYDYWNVTWHLDATFVHTGVVYQGRGQILWHLSLFRSVYKPDRWHQLQWQIYSIPVRILSHTMQLWAAHHQFHSGVRHVDRHNCKSVWIKQGNIFYLYVDAARFIDT